MHDSIFREYDIRGKIGSELIIAEVYNLIRSIAFYYKQKNAAVKTVVVGIDGRISSPEIKQEVVAGLTDSGLDVVFIGVCPSPVLYFSLHTLAVDAGLMITASHNPAEYNGIKISLGTHAVWGAEIKNIRDLYRAQRYAVGMHKGSYQERAIIPDYIAWLKKHFSSLIAMPLAAVIDCGNGACGSVLPDLIAAMGWEHCTLLCAEVDGTYPNHEADPVIEKNMVHVKNTLSATGATVGIGFDGDGDRMAAMTQIGFLVPGDQLLAIFAQDVLKNNPQSTIVFDVKASSGLIELLQHWGAQPLISPCGHAIIKNNMEKSNALLAGELSCHFFFRDVHFGYDDGIYAMMRLFEIIEKSGKSLNELLSIFPKKYSSPEIRIPCEEDKKEAIINWVKHYFAARGDADILTIDGSL